MCETRHGVGGPPKLVEYVAPGSVPGGSCFGTSNPTPTPTSVNVERKMFSLCPGLCIQ
jgi:hypothetical protein